MPTVPTRPSLALQPAQQARYSAQGTVPVQDQTPRMLGQQAQAFQQAGQDWGRYAAETQRRADIAFTTERQTQAAEADLNDWSAYSQKQGKAAYDGFEDFRSTVQKRYEKIAETAENEQQRQWLKEHGQQQVLRMTERAMAHRDKEVAVWRVGSAKADSKQKIREYAATGTPEALEGIVKSHQDLARLTGVDETADAIGLAHIARTERLLGEGRTGEALAVLNEHGSKIDPEALTKVRKQARAQEIGDIARMLDQSVGTLDERLAAVDEAEAKGLPREEADLGRRHLFSLENQRDARNAEIAADVEVRARQWRQANPGLPLSANPDLAEQVATYGVKLDRVTDQRKLAEFYNDPPAALDRLRSLTPQQLHLELASYLDAHDEGAVTKFLRGDEGGARIDDLTKLLARQIAILPGNDSNDDATPLQNRRFELWKATTIAPILKAERDRLKRDLTPDEFQKLVVNPVLADKVWTDSGTNRELPLMQLQQQGLAPVDDPTTEKNESLNYDAYSSLFVNVEGQQVVLRDIPMEARKAIRDDWAKSEKGKAGVWLSAAEEASLWLSMKAKRETQQKAELNQDLMKRVQQELQGKMPR